MYCRRKFLIGVGGVGIAGVLAGCSSNDSEDGPASTPTATPTESPTPTPTPKPRIEPDELDGYIRPEEDPLTVPEELSCDRDEFERRSGWIDEENVQWGEVTDEDGNPVFGLRVDTLTVERGDTVMITLTNISGTEQKTANPGKSDLDIYTEAGWQDPRGWEDGQPKPVTDDLVSFEPGESHKWEFEMTEDGIVEGDYHDAADGFVTCPELPIGRYRFATTAPNQGDVAIAFDLTE